MLNFYRMEKYIQAEVIFPNKIRIFFRKIYGKSKIPGH
jgi:hypothetical protein